MIPNALSTMTLIYVLLGSFLASTVLTGGIRRLALRQDLLDTPQARSAHAIPTPIGGGLSLVLLTAAVSLYSVSSGLISTQIFLALCGGFFVAILGLIDDLKALPIRLRVLLQFVAAIWSLVWIGEVAPIDVGGWVLEQQLILSALALFALVWFLNLYNFMDGIDGIAGSELLTTSLFVLVFSINSEQGGVVLLCITLIGSVAGFLVWNWAPAKIFMGDAGSGYIGFLLGLLAIFTMQQGLMTLWTWLIIMGVFITDATVTLFRRALSGQRWFEGHASHAYQHAAQYYKSHAKVTITVIVINCVWLAPLAALSVVERSFGLVLCLISLLPLIWLALKWQAGIEHQNGRHSNGIVG